MHVFVKRTEETKIKVVRAPEKDGNWRLVSLGSLWLKCHNKYGIR